jgi:CRP-like cAMP-binding protein
VSSTYQVRAKRWAHGWELHIEGVGVTQSHTLRDAERIARDYIALDTGTDPGSINVEITPEIGGELGEKTAAARRAVAEAEDARRAAAVRSRDAARELLVAGLSGRDIAAVLQVSPQRVSQLLNDARASALLKDGARARKAKPRAAAKRSAQPRRRSGAG